MKASQDIAAIKGRLRDTLRAKEISERSASVAAGLSPGFLHSVLSGDTDPSLSRILMVCEANGLDQTFILLGFEASPQTRRLVELLESSPERRDHILALLSDR